MDNELNRETRDVKATNYLYVHHDDLDQAHERVISKRRPYKRNEVPYPLVGIVAMAIHSSSLSHVTVKDIVQSAKFMFPEVKREWQNSVCKVVNRYDCFVKVMSKKGGWSLDISKIPPKAFKLRGSARNGEWADELHDQLGLMPINVPALKIRREISPRFKQSNHNSEISYVTTFVVESFRKQDHDMVPENATEINLHQQTILPLEEAENMTACPNMDCIVVSSCNSSFSTLEEYPLIDLHLQQRQAKYDNELHSARSEEVINTSETETFSGEAIQHSVPYVGIGFFSDEVIRHSIPYVKTETFSEDAREHSVSHVENKTFSETILEYSVPCAGTETSPEEVTEHSVPYVKTETFSLNADDAFYNLCRESLLANDTELDLYYNPHTLCPYQVRLHKTVQKWLNSNEHIKYNTRIQDQMSLANL